MGCHSSKQDKKAKAEEPKPPKFDVASQAPLEKPISAQNNREVLAERITFSNEEKLLAESHQEVVKDVELPGMNVGTTPKSSQRNVEPSEEDSSVTKHSTSVKDQKDPANNESSDKIRENEHLDENRTKEYEPRNYKQLQIRTKTKRNRAEPEDDTLYEVPLKMPEFDLVPSHSEESVAF